MKNKTTHGRPTFPGAHLRAYGRGRLQGLIFLLLVFALMAAAITGVSTAGQEPPPPIPEVVAEQSTSAPIATTASWDSLQLIQYSINAAGAIDDSSANYRLGFSLGQPVVGTASSASYRTAIGFWGGPSLFKCGDANGDETINVGDAVHVINYVFKGGPEPNPIDAGDANCDETINVGDAVHIINYVFKGGPEPCCP